MEAFRALYFESWKNAVKDEQGKELLFRCELVIACGDWFRYWQVPFPRTIDFNSA